MARVNIFGLPDIGLDAEVIQKILVEQGDLIKWNRARSHFDAIKTYTVSISTFSQRKIDEFIRVKIRGMMCLIQVTEVEINSPSFSYLMNDAFLDKDLNEESIQSWNENEDVNNDSARSQTYKEDVYLNKEVNQEENEEASFQQKSQNTENERLSGEVSERISTEISSDLEPLSKEQMYKEARLKNLNYSFDQSQNSEDQNFKPLNEIWKRRPTKENSSDEEMEISRTLVSLSKDDHEDEQKSVIVEATDL